MRLGAAPLWQPGGRDAAATPKSAAECVAKWALTSSTASTCVQTLKRAPLWFTECMRSTSA
eukprot:7557830-Pyramimonas_sp.AAC.1